MNRLDDQLAAFLVKTRGSETYASFARKLKITPSTLFRLENGQQSASLKLMERICTGLKVKITDIFEN